MSAATAQALVLGQSRGGGRVVSGAHEGVDVAIVTFEEAREQLVTNEAGRAGEQDVSHLAEVPNDGAG